MVKAGDSIPDIELTEGNPGNKVNLSKELGSGLIIGVPAAFSKCAANSYLWHLASYSLSSNAILINSS
jgi:2-Cys peroxiredoxin 5